MSNNSQDEERQFDELRHLLLGPELKKLKQLSEHMENPDRFSSDVGDVLPQAMLKSAKDGTRLSEAMVPTVEEIVRLSIKRDINKFANALFPVIGPAIRKAIKETIRQMLQSLNQVLEHGLSWRGIKWRLESIRTGIPFAQIVMLNSLEFRVEQVFLIHRKTGILLNHVEQENSQNQNADMVSSMLTAIGDFVGDSFDVDNRQDLDSIQVGDFSILIEQGPGAILAVASRGNAPGSLRNTMLQTLEDVQTQLDAQLEIFKGDTAPFEKCKVQLLDCMIQSDKNSGPDKISLKAKLLWIIAFILFIYWIASNIYISIQQQDYVNLLEKEPGFIITQVIHDGDSLSIKGLKDPLARDPQKFMAITTLNPEDISLQFAPYYSLDNFFVEKRLIKTLNPPVNVSMKLQAGELTIEGYANEQKIAAISMMAPLIAGIDGVNMAKLKSNIDLSSLKAPETIKFSIDINKGLVVSTGKALDSWTQFAKEQAHHIDGILTYDDSRVKSIVDLSVFNAPETVSIKLQKTRLILTGLADHVWIESTKKAIKNYDEISSIDISQLQNRDELQLTTAIQALQKEFIFFDAAYSFNLEANEPLNNATLLITQIIQLTKTLSLPLKITIEGFSDSVGRFEDNVYLSKDRANYVAQHIYNSGISPKYIIIKGIDTPVKKETTNAEQRYNRRVTFSVQLNPENN